MFNLSRRPWFKLLNLFLIVVFLATSGFGCKLMSAKEKEKIKPITLNYWRSYDDADAFEEIIKDYQIIHPNIQINYRKFRPEEYEKELLNALAEDRGPDIFSIPETQLRSYQTKIAPMPKEIEMAYQYVKGTLKKETVIEVRTTKSPTLREIKDQYTDTVFADAVIDNQVWGLPLSMDTLVMFYNKDILNQSGISQPPTEWKAFQEAAAKCTRFDADNNIIQSGAALGTGFNVDRSFDILSILMMQSGAIMANSKNDATFFNENRKMGDNGKAYNDNPGLNALQFYTDFASPTKNVYSWNTAVASSSFEAFLAGKVGFFFGYNYHIPQIRSRSRINFAIAPIPQIAGLPIKNYANYWLETISKKSAYTNEAWDFLLFLNKKEEITKYLAKAKYPTSQKALLEAQYDDEDLYASASQVLTAGTWYKGYNIAGAEQTFKELIEKFLAMQVPEDELNNIMKTAISKISQTNIKPE